MKLWPALILTAVVSVGCGFVLGRATLQQTGPREVSLSAPAQPPASATQSGITVAPVEAVASGPAPPTGATGVRALNLQRVALDTQGAQAQACLIFSAPLASGSDSHPGDFLSLAPAARPAVQVVGNRICLGGLAFGTQYSLTLRAGLQGADGSRTLADETLPLSLGDVPPQASFADDGFILPRNAGGLPIATVNLTHVHLRVDRITDHALVRSHPFDEYPDNGGEYDAKTGKETDRLGAPVWEGDLEVRNVRNEKTVTAFPLDRLLQPRQPGAYRITLVQPARDSDSQPQESQRWIFDTDLMLTTHRGTDGLHVFVRSLASARPLPGIDVALMAASNDELGRARTGADGQALFAPGLLRGRQGLMPRMVMAYDGGDFAALQLDRPGFDLSDRGVDGRPDPGPVDAWLYVDRGIYRPGERIFLTTIVRDRMAAPLPEGHAVTLLLRRPNGVEAGRWRLVPNAVGAAVQTIALSPAAPRGNWRLEESLAGTSTVIGSLELQVQDFVPNQLAVELAPRSARITTTAPAVIDIASRYLYGAPAAGLEVSAHVQLQRDLAPVGEPGWQFGRADEVLNVEALDLPGPRTDAAGHSSLGIDAAQLKAPDSSLPLRADVTVSVTEPGGRATESRTSLKLVTRDILLGLKPADPEGSLDEGRAGSVAVAAFGADGSRLARRLTFQLIEQVTEFNYYSEDGRWQWKTATHDRPVTFGSIDVPAIAGGAPITLPPLDWGSYRLEVSDAASGARSSVILHAGYSPAANLAASPEKIAVALVGPPPRVGQLARLHIKPPFAGEMLLTVENSRVLAAQTASIPAAGADITVLASADWGAGAYVMASVYRPAHDAAGHAPVRAVGLAYVPLDESARTLGVRLELPALLRPRAHLDLPVSVSGTAAHGPVWLTLAAVDEGILQLTRFPTPDPEAHFFGKRQLAVELRDDYAHLIDGDTAASGAIRSGGDIDGVGLSVVPTRTTSIFSGLVQLGADGRAVLPLDLPDFTGGLRFMAVAVSADGFGHSEAQLPVRDPVVAQLSLPRFLAPGDAARMTLLAHDVEAGAGSYHIHMVAGGALAMPPVDDELHLDAGQALVRSYPLAAGATGTGRIDLTLTGPAGMRITHDWEMEVRTPFQSETRVSAADQKPGESFRLDASLARGLVAKGATLRASFSSVGRIDLPGLLAALDAYPFGCSEQLVSRAMPMLYVGQENSATGGVAPADLRPRVQDAVDRLLERQDEQGAFGLWRVGDREATPYLGALITDFLMRARAHGFTVPEHALKAAHAALGSFDSGAWMLRRFWDPAASGDHDDEAVMLAGRAYAALLATRAGEGDLSELRYLNDTVLGKMEPLGQAQLAVALGLLGDRTRAAAAFAQAERGLAGENDALAGRSGDFYRTRLRDIADLVALSAELDDAPRTARLLAALDRLDMRTDQLNTQEQAALLLAAGVLLEKAGPVSVSVDGVAQKPQAVVSLERPADAPGDGITMTNTGAATITRIVSTRGLPVVAPPASASHITIGKSVTAADGGVVDLGHLHQNQRLVVHLSGVADDAAYHQTMLVDPLPAGFEIERIVAPSSPDAANGLPWLGGITPTRMAEMHDDRFMAAIDLGPGPAGGAVPFNVAYVVRVVSPGRFVLPAASIRDMYRPDIQARGEVGAVTVETAP